MASIADTALIATLAPAAFGREAMARERGPDTATPATGAAVFTRAPPQDTVSLSPEARARLSADGDGRAAGVQNASAEEDPEAAERAQDPDGLTEEERAIVDDMAQRDREVRDHEMAHAIAGGPYTGPPRYQMEQGPDGRSYAVSGEVDIDVSPESDPEATIRKMEIVKRAALAPADPSPEDRAIAQMADQIRMQAQQDLQAQREAERTEARERDDAAAAGAPAPAGTNAEGGIDDRLTQAVSAYTAAASLLGAMAMGQGLRV